MTSRPHGYRLSTGGIIERSRRLGFTFNGRTLSGHPGDTLASALVANGVNLIARSFKYHRPRGIYGVGLEDPNSMLAVRDAHGYDPAIRAGQVRLTAGLEAHSVSGYPSVNFDIGAAAQIFSGVLGAGFYYKTFKWPGWKLFEPSIRRMTGIGRARIEADHRRVEHRHRKVIAPEESSVGGDLAAQHRRRQLAVQRELAAADQSGRQRFLP